MKPYPYKNKSIETIFPGNGVVNMQWQTLFALRDGMYEQLMIRRQALFAIFFIFIALLAHPGYAMAPGTQYKESAPQKLSKNDLLHLSRANGGKVLNTHMDKASYDRTIAIDSAPCKQTDMSSTNIKYTTAFFFNHNLYFAGKPILENATAGALYLAKSTLDASGKLTPISTFASRALVNKKSDGHFAVASVVYKGEVYLFYDAQVGHGGKNYQIRYKTSSNPDLSWQPADEKGFGTFAYGFYKHGWRKKTASIKPVVFNDKIYVFYWAFDRIMYVTFDGETWSRNPKPVPVPWSEQKVSPRFIAEAVNLSGKALVCIGQTSEKNELMKLSFMDQNHQVNTNGPTINFKNAAQIDNYISSGIGSIGGAGQQQGNVLQIFAHTVWFFHKHVVRCEVNLDTNSVSEWKSTNLPVHWPQHKTNFLPLITTTMAQAANTQDIRQYLITFLLQLPDANRIHALANSYPSDYFKFIKKSDQLDTDADDTKEKKCWSVLGVIEGCPPFTRNGVNDAKRTSSVVYGQARTKSVEVKVSYNSSLSLKAKLGSLVSIEGKLKETFGQVNDLIKEKTQKLVFTFDNTNLNVDGRFGWMIISKPMLSSNTYERYSYDQRVKLSDFVMVNVDDIAITYEHYSLEAPASGMQVRSPSTNLSFWHDVQLPLYQNIQRFKLGAITASLFGATTKVDLNVTQRAINTKSNKSTLTITGKAAKKDLFEFEASGEVSMDFMTKVSTKLSQNISATLRLPKPASNVSATEKLTVRPIWYLPKANVLLNQLATRPFWISDAFATSNSIPWCLTWKVTSIKAATPNSNTATTAHSACRDLNGDGRSDLVVVTGQPRTGSAGSVQLTMVCFDGKKIVTQDSIDLSAENMTPLASGNFDPTSDASGILFHKTDDDQLIVVNFAESDYQGTHTVLNSSLGSQYQFLTVGNYNEDELIDELLMANISTNTLEIWALDYSDTDNAYIIADRITLNTEWNSKWECPGNVDFNNDGFSDILLKNSDTHQLRGLIIDDLGVKEEKIICESQNNLTNFLDIGDYNGDGKSDLLFANQEGGLTVCIMNSLEEQLVARLHGMPNMKRYDYLASGDFNGDGFSDIIVNKTKLGKKGDLPALVCFIKTSTKHPLKVYKRKILKLKDLDTLDITVIR